MYGKCYIYKRATFLAPGQAPQIVDYTDGTEPFNCEVEMGSNGYPVYHWKLMNEVIDIPLNIPRHKVDGILRNGSVAYEGGELQWEFIFGKYRSFPKFYFNQLLQLLPLLLVLIVLMYLLSPKRPAAF